MTNLPATSSQYHLDRALLRHAVATVAYRGGKTLRDAPGNFSSFTCGGGCLSAGAILAHIGDLFDWALSIANGDSKWRDAATQSWDEDVARFYASLAAFDARLASDAPVQAPLDKLMQGPVADALTHVGQLAMMRRLAGAPIKGENYFVADIAPGRVGPEQAMPKREF
ncbi:MAG: hypothetical protein V4587_15565 [Acidobacteriota bacterium]